MTKKPKPAPRRPRKRNAASGQHQPPAESREALVGRLWRVAERQVRDIERRPDAAPQRAGGHDTRMLAVLARTMRELNALDQATGRTTDDDDAGPKDIDEFRNELARRIQEIIAARDSN